MSRKPETSKHPPHVYGVSPDAMASGRVPPDILQRIRKDDPHGRYRRPSFGPRGERLLDAQGRPAFDESVFPVRQHFTYAGKGFELVELIRDTPAVEPGDADPLPALVEVLARADIACEYRRGEQRDTFSAKHHAALVSKGWELLGSADQQRLRNLAEATLPADGRTVEQAKAQAVLDPSPVEIAGRG